jgi:hypothetical protein
VQETRHTIAPTTDPSDIIGRNVEFVVTGGHGQPLHTAGRWNSLRHMNLGGDDVGMGGSITTTNRGRTYAFMRYGTTVTYR